MSLSDIALSVGATDLFVLRKVADEQLFNIDGIGRGAGWAGNVSIQPSQEPFIARVLDQGHATKRSGVPFRAFGPYWTSEIAAAQVADCVVAFGGTGVAELDPEHLAALGSEAMEAAAVEIAEEKLEADESEVRQAIESLREGAEGNDLEDLARHVASATARALSCEFGAVVLNGPPPRLFIADEGWRPAASDEETIAALLPLHQAVIGGIFVEQDLSSSNFPYRPLSFDDGVIARCVVPLGERGELGLLVTAHTGNRPRGFTDLCQRVAISMGAAGGPLLEAATSST